MTAKENRSNFALMDELEEKENLQSKGTVYRIRNPWNHHGRIYRLIRKLHLSPSLVFGSILLLAGYILNRLHMGILGWSFLGFGAIFAVFGVFEKFVLDKTEDDE